jgi:hypothetical protein
MTDYILDPIERGEARAERFEDRIRGDIYTCSCGNKCSLMEAETFSPDPYAEPFCPKCIEKALDDELRKN